MKLLSITYWAPGKTVPMKKHRWASLSKDPIPTNRIWQDVVCLYDPNTPVERFEDCPRGEVVLVAGGRYFKDRKWGYATLDSVAKEARVLITGKASGADAMSEDWALDRGISVLDFRADWKGLGAAAGPKRNQRMLVDGLPDLVVAFPGGPGTSDMVRRARAHGVPTIQFV